MFYVENIGDNKFFNAARNFDASRDDKLKIL